MALYGVYAYSCAGRAASRGWPWEDQRLVLVVAAGLADPFPVYPVRV